MNRLQKAAWLNLAVGTACIAFAGLCFAFPAKRNARGPDFVLIRCKLEGENGR